MVKAGESPYEKLRRERMSRNSDVMKKLNIERTQAELRDTVYVQENLDVEAELLSKRVEVQQENDSGLANRAAAIRQKKMSVQKRKRRPIVGREGQTLDQAMKMKVRPPSTRVASVTPAPSSPFPSFFPFVSETKRLIPLTKPLVPSSPPLAPLLTFVWCAFRARQAAAMAPTRKSSRIRGGKPDAGESGETLSRSLEVAESPSAQLLTSSEFFEGQGLTFEPAFESDGKFYGWVEEETCARYGIEADPDSAWEKNGGGKFTFKIKKVSQEQGHI